MNDQRICLIRHGQTTWNKERKIQGLEDIPLNETGYRQAKDCGEALLKAGWSGCKIVSSPLTRALETAKCIGEVLGIPEIGIAENLKERIKVITVEKLLKLLPVSQRILKAVRSNFQRNNIRMWNPGNMFRSVWRGALPKLQNNKKMM